MRGAGRSTAVDDGEQTGTDWRLVRRLLRYVAAHKRLFLLALALYPLDALSVVLPPFLVRQIIDVAIPRGDLGLLHTLVLLYVVALVVEYGAGFSSKLAMSVLGQRSMMALRSDLFRHVQKLPAAYFDRHNYKT